MSDDEEVVQDMKEAVDKKCEPQCASFYIAYTDCAARKKAMMKVTALASTLITRNVSTTALRSSSSRRHAEPTVHA
eukprot:CAMPEP_0206058330 /NCGR_PEP_ID=MMETSP1466-20131121/46405_1 /ASSEMBLY_ACC=CAM_ASM_001126 /TAXON_ID=44452 /ORGANISM="Pavlova gyrans, Strain CCMP608" /LENGTH=75 /DNA_ID=CAMNT_0053433625 /DNA_START=79 /DNA_END=307 /DNA_ORIENTATION=-